VPAVFQSVGPDAAAVHRLSSGKSVVVVPPVEGAPLYVIAEVEAAPAFELVSAPLELVNVLMPPKELALLNWICVSDPPGAPPPLTSAVQLSTCQLVPSEVIQHPRSVAIVRVAAPLIVEVVGVIVTVPAPLFWTPKEKPAAKEPVAWGSVTATAEPLESVTSLEASVDSTV
jgi:hypothetical protein